MFPVHTNTTRKGAGASDMAPFCMHHGGFADNSSPTRAGEFFLHRFSPPAQADSPVRHATDMSTTTAPDIHAIADARAAAAAGHELLLQAREVWKTIVTDCRWISPAGQRFTAEMEGLLADTDGATTEVDAWETELRHAAWSLEGCS